MKCCTMHQTLSYVLDMFLLPVLANLVMGCLHSTGKKWESDCIVGLDAKVR